MIRGNQQIKISWFAPKYFDQAEFLKVVMEVLGMADEDVRQGEMEANNPLRPLLKKATETLRGHG